MDVSFATRKMTARDVSFATRTMMQPVVCTGVAFLIH